MTTGIGLLLILIGMIAGLGIVLWLFTHSYERSFDKELLEKTGDTLSAFDDGYVLGFEAGGGEYSVLPPDEVLERYVMHRDRY